jgi:phenylacetyl-CoA:acceptor oxidoreductase
VTHSVEAIWDATCKAASAEITDGTEAQGLDWYKEQGFRLAEFPRLKWYLYAEIEKQNLRFEMPYQERLMRVGKELGRRLHEQGISWWDEQLEEYDPLPEYKNYPEVWEKALERNFDVDIRDFPFWAITARSMQYAWGSNAGSQLMREVAENVSGHGGIVINSETVAELGLADGDLVEVRSPLNVTRGRVVARQGIRPDTVLMIGQFEHWATPFAKDLELPSLNKLVPMLLDLTDSTGSGSDLVRVSIKRVENAR